MIPVPDELLEEILHRLPPDDPGCLFRASAVCRPWRSLATSPGFARRYREFHGTPPLLGFFEIHDAFGCWFAPSSPTSPIPPIHPDPRELFVLDSRHGLVLVRTPGWEDNAPTAVESFIVWDPVARRQWEFPPPEFAAKIMYDNAVLLCDDADRLGCRGGPFTVVYVGNVRGSAALHASVYSSETRAWTDVALGPGILPGMHPELLRGGHKAILGNLLYFSCCDHQILRYDLISRELSTIKAPMAHEYYVLVKTEEGVLGCAMMHESELWLWSIKTGPKGAVTWTKRTVFELEEQLGPSDLLAFVDGPPGVFYLKIGSCIFTVELKSGRVKKIPTSSFSFNSCWPLIPYMSFYTPDQAGPRMLPSTMASSSGGQVGDEQGKGEEEGGWEEVNAEKECFDDEHQEDKAVQKLFDKKYKAIKDGDVVCAVNCLRRALKIRGRVAHHGKLSPKCFSTYFQYGLTLLDKTLLKTASASNQEFLDAVTMQYGTGHSEDLDLAWRMLHVARSILEKSPGSTMEKVETFAALAEVSIQGEDIDCSLIACFKALAILEHLVDPDHRHIFDLPRNLQIRFAFELETKIRDAKAITLCKSHIESLKRANEDFLADKGDDASASEVGSWSLAKSIEYLTEQLLRALEKKLEDLEEAISTPVSVAILLNVGSSNSLDGHLSASDSDGSVSE